MSDMWEKLEQELNADCDITAVLGDHSTLAVAHQHLSDMHNNKFAADEIEASVIVLLVRCRGCGEPHKVYVSATTEHVALIRHLLGSAMVQTLGEPF